MDVQAKNEQTREAKIKAYAEALAYFIEEPNAISDPSLKVCVDFFKERIAQEEARQVSVLGIQKRLMRAQN
jgi:hypothetical protein